MAARKSRIRVVADDERAAPQTVTEAVERGTERDLYRTMRARIARAIDSDDIRGADLAALTKRMHDLAREIKALDAQAKEEAEDGGPVPDAAWEAI